MPVQGGQTAAEESLTARDREKVGRIATPGRRQGLSKDGLGLLRAVELTEHLPEIREQPAYDRLVPGYIPPFDRELFTQECHGFAQERFGVLVRVNAGKNLGKVSETVRQINPIRLTPGRPAPPECKPFAQQGRAFTKQGIGLTAPAESKEAMRSFPVR
jgi:hypothetical protein